MPVQNGQIVESRDESTHLVLASWAADVFALNRNFGAPYWVPAAQLSPQGNANLSRHDRNVDLVHSSTSADKLDTVPNLPLPRRTRQLENERACVARPLGFSCYLGRCTAALDEPAIGIHRCYESFIGALH
jgi:hypothetical protein